MADDVIIKAEGLGKRYLIGHQTERERYVALRDVIARNVRNLARTARDMVRGRPLVAGDEVEEFWALKDINFEIRRGDVVGIIGRNGAGKSTLLKILARITEPTTGRVEIRGRVASLLEVGTGFHPELTGRENIYLNGAILGMTRAEIKRKFDEIVDFAGVEKFLDTPVKRYSSGMYVRLAFAVAAHLDPEILLVDEVLAVGDAQFQKKCLGKMGEVAQGGRTVLFVSHNMGAVKQICKKGIVLDKGKIFTTGSAKEIIEKYIERNMYPENLFIRKNVEKLKERGVIISKIWIPTKDVFQDGYVEVVLQVIVKYSVKNIIFGIGFCDTMGGRILTVNSNYRKGGVFSFRDPGVYMVKISIRNLALNAAIYLIDVGCAFEGGVMIDEVKGAMSILVHLPESSVAISSIGYHTALLEASWAVSQDG